MDMSPAKFYILNQEGLLKAAQDISPDMKISLDEGAQKLTITGLPAEVYKTKSWILERTVGTSKKQLNVPPSKSQSINDVNGFSSQVKETIHVGSFAVVQFIEYKKKQELCSIAKDNAVKVQFDSARPKITLAGAPLHVQKAKFCFQQLTSALSTDNFVVDKPGAKKYFETQGSLFLSTIMTGYSCVVVLCPISQSQQYSASFGQVSSTSLGVYQMQMGQLTLEVSSGDITKEACDVIINSSNKDFSLRSGVSKAILDSAGLTVEQECSRIVSSPSFQSDTFILTSAGLLPSKNIIHIVGQKDPASIKEVVYSVLKYCEDNKFNSVTFPALGTGQGRVRPSDVADAMVDAVVDFVRKKQTRFVHRVKILIFQTDMMSLFHKSMKKREGQEQPSADHLVLENEEFEPAVFQLCADNDMAVKQAKKRIEELIVAEQAQKTITDQYISHLSQEDMDQLKALQRKMTVSIRLERGQEPQIHLEGLTRDVYNTESAIRDIIRKGKRNRKIKALMIKGHVEWQFDFGGIMVPFDDDTNLTLEEAREKKQLGLTITIDNENYHADVMKLNAVSVKGNKQLELLRKELKADDAALPSHWDDMKGDVIKLFPVAAGSQEYTDVETELRNTGLTPNIISIERVQNTILWKSYQLLKKQLDVKNKHNNNNNERKLFHSSGAYYIDLINKRASTAATPEHMGYAKPDTRHHKRMYLAKVLVGDFTTGRPGMINPPIKSSSNTTDLYDSVADNSTNPTIFVIFNDIQAYPEYLITFT
ncbi:hypothetical protein F7725_013973 [Dissostichus mawsoni]|uniref:Poly [ADP-ribose] polymerase n=1 Tax=Dissostichus mawsoni TaxID=36200 RepID=A0A7J5YUW1_DISMA|nr:hypothetical protein F7725_013973 [Dissostichus mawsoni]